MKNYKATNVGAALITALLLVAFVVMTVGLLIDTQKISIKTTEQLIDSTNAYYNALGVEDWALGYFKIQWANQTGSNKADWPKVLPQMLIPGGKIKGRIHDLQGMFNINNISNIEGQQQFIRLLQAVIPDLPLTEQIELSGKILQRIAGASIVPDNNPLLSKYPFQSSHQFIYSVSELRMIDGMDQNLYEALVPYITALPEWFSRININTASVPVLMSLSDQITEQEAFAIIDFRTQNKGIANINDIANLKIPPQNLTVDSTYFLIEADVIMNDQALKHYSLIKVNPTNEKLDLIVLWRSQGTL